MMSMSNRIDLIERENRLTIYLLTKRRSCRKSSMNRIRRWREFRFHAFEFRNSRRARRHVDLEANHQLKAKPPENCRFFLSADLLYPQLINKQSDISVENGETEDPSASIGFVACRDEEAHRRRSTSQGRGGINPLWAVTKSLIGESNIGLTTPQRSRDEPKESVQWRSTSQTGF